MVANPERRSRLADAAIDILGADGPRALTHRAVDRKSQLPLGTSSNYFSSRAELMLAMTHRIFELLAPAPDRLEELAVLPEGEAPAEYARYVTERLLERPHVAAALIELRLEAARSDNVRAALEPVLRQGFLADVAFHQERGLPGGHSHVLWLHHLVNGAVLDAISVPLQPQLKAGDVVAQAVRDLAT